MLSCITTRLLVTAALCALSFYAGTLHATHVCMDAHMRGDAGGADPVVEALVKQRLAEEMDRIKVTTEAELHTAGGGGGGGGDNDSTGADQIRKKEERFPRTLSGVAQGMVRTSKADFVKLYDFGNPHDAGKAPRDRDALILYSKPGAFPNVNNDTLSRITHEDGQGIPKLESASKATENCMEMNVLLVDNPDGQPQCLVLINNYQSYHVQRWMKVGNSGGINPRVPLRLVSRGVTGNGIRSYKSPTKEDIFDHWDMLKRYLNSLDEVLAELKPIAAKVATGGGVGSPTGNTVIVMTCNFGQSELLMNYVCAAKSRKLDSVLNNVLVFPTDRETEELAKGLGLATYYDKRNFESMPSKEAGRYGDKRFVAMMYAKVVCVQLITVLGYDVLFQDVDIVWYRDPLGYFRLDNSTNKGGGTGAGPKEIMYQTPGYPYDVYFQDDGAHTVRYAPFSANSGFYYVRNNERTRYLFTSLLYVGDLIRITESHQQALIALLNEHSSLFGLRVKVLNREMEEFPGGYNFHRKRKDYMKKVMDGRIKPYIFHMSWTTNKRNKLKFFQQMGEWYVDQEKCVQKKADEIQGGGSKEAGSLVEPCCLAQPVFKCYYRDKPSREPCRDSPPIDKDARSWW